MVDQLSPDKDNLKDKEKPPGNGNANENANENGKELNDESRRRSSSKVQINDGEPEVFILPETASPEASSSRACYGILRERTRFLVCVIALTSLTVSVMCRMLLQTSINSMAVCQASAIEKTVATYKVCPMPVASPPSQVSKAQNPLLNPSPEASGKLKWSNEQCDSVLGAFFLGYAAFMIPGGSLAERYGSKFFLLGGVLTSGLITLASPWLASVSYVLFYVARVVMGMLQAAILPAMYSVFAKWLTGTESNFFAPLIKMNLRFGMTLGSFLPFLFDDWQGPFYATGVVCLVWCALCFLLVTSEPKNNKWVSDAELERIYRKKEIKRLRTVDTHESLVATTKDSTSKQVEAIELKSKEEFEEVNLKEIELSEETVAQQPPVKKAKAAKRPVPWRRIMSSPSVWGLMILKFTVNNGVDFLALMLPTYLVKVYHTTKEEKELITSFIFVLQMPLIVVTSWISTSVLLAKPFGASKTAIRLFFQGINNFGVTIFMLLITMVDCDLVYTCVLLQCISVCTLFSAGGEVMIPYDLSHEFPATIMAIANGFANLSGLIISTLSGQIKGEQADSVERWTLFIRIIAASSFIGGIVSLLFIKCEPIDLSDPKAKQSDDVEASLSEQDDPNKPSGSKGNQENHKDESQNSTKKPSIKAANKVERTQVESPKDCEASKQPERKELEATEELDAEAPKTNETPETSGKAAGVETGGDGGAKKKRAWKNHGLFR